MLLPVCSKAQLAPTNERGVTMGHWHSIVLDVEASKKFWMLFGAEPITIDGTAVMKLPGILIFLTQGTSTGSTMGTSLNHVGLRVSNGKDLKDRLKAAGVKEDPTDPVTGRPGFWKPGLRGWGNVYSADGLKIEILDNVVEGEAGLTAKIAGVADPTQKKDLPPVASDHNHMYLPTKASVKEAEEWYSKMFGARSFSDTGRLAKNLQVVDFKSNMVDDMTFRWDGSSRRSEVRATVQREAAQEFCERRACRSVGNVD